MIDAKLPRGERLRSMHALRRLFDKGRGGFVYPFRYVFFAETPADAGPEESAAASAAESAESTAAESAVAPAEVPVAESVTAPAAVAPSAGCAGAPPEVMFSVPKRYHKRANRRNLLRRRTKEAYRLNKSLLSAACGRGLDVALIYSSKEVLPYKNIEDAVRRILEQIARRM